MSASEGGESESSRVIGRIISCSRSGSGRFFIYRKSEINSFELKRNHDYCL